MADLALNVASLRRRSRANGPGLRAAVWVQGCTLRCPGCFNPHTHAHAPRHLWDPEALARDLLADPAIEGVTLLGGEPFEQAAAAAALAERVQADGRTVMTYSGYTYARLQRSGGDVARLLAATDLLCAGPYVARLPCDDGWRGSSNQQIIALTPAYAGLAARAAAPLLEVEVDAGGLRFTGQPTGADLAWLQGLASS